MSIEKPQPWENMGLIVMGKIDKFEGRFNKLDDKLDEIMENVSSKSLELRRDIRKLNTKFTFGGLFLFGLIILTFVV